MHSLTGHNESRVGKTKPLRHLTFEIMAAGVAVAKKQQRGGPRTHHHAQSHRNLSGSA
jgi:hypothetical protein